MFFTCVREEALDAGLLRGVGVPAAALALDAVVDPVPFKMLLRLEQQRWLQESTRSGRDPCICTAMSP